ncbi:hypothetical protein DdX_15684 [Ditylenchus destructor]|uniref:G-protein coupled receptors family 1 profile domain-containing protein n=1 Tax=Ditylenchus destructor TaxID=166010 RepID=A0AAD4R0K5_9BILA|nr:hypothetical protein DdX_15684 [Ditylenchus destructor]
MSVYVYAPGVPIFFLTLDRCMALKFPVQYHNNSKWIRGRLPAVTTVLTVLWCVAYLTTIVVSVPPDMTQATYCQTLTCVKNRVALVTIVSDILLNVVPTVFAIVFLNVTGVSPGNIIGNNVILMFTLDAAICSLFYNRTYMRKAFKNGKICFMHSSGNANT